MPVSLQKGFVRKAAGGTARRGLMGCEQAHSTLFEKPVFRALFARAVRLMCSVAMVAEDGCHGRLDHPRDILLCGRGRVKRRVGRGQMRVQET
ncbi:hypothetical protein C7453_103313 [Gluconacetobacter liquefaciens]|uniref:Uncharacterized protein n=1 Tax=Gluconacetobacter liquefaciens TaxID=89584 RepID=A0A370G4Z0_GLULI|nr:hypothetical protein C7453_103313 [Gluconacetobacter liquefaciens]